MDTINVISIAASLFSIALAIFAIWIARKDREASQLNYEHTKTVMNEIEKVLEKTQILVSDNFQKLLSSAVDQQQRMLNTVLSPKPTTQEKFIDLAFQLLREDVDKFDKLINTIKDISSNKAGQSSDLLKAILQTNVQKRQELPGK